MKVDLALEGLNSIETHPYQTNPATVFLLGISVQACSKLGKKLLWLFGVCALIRRNTVNVL